jgi:hypothetical protein
MYVPALGGRARKTEIACLDFDGALSDRNLPEFDGLAILGAYRIDPQT